jgi:ribosomal protein L11 methyltransferase
MLALFPAGFEEVDKGETLELAAYTDAEGAAALFRAFGEYSATAVDGDWAERWRRFHRPTRVGSVWIGPPWLDPPPDAVPVVIDPGRAFGTGAHPTTRLCIELLGKCQRGALLDAGSGSGVLAIAAARLGFRPVLALDHDEAAVAATRANAQRNGVVVDARRRDVLVDPLPSVEVVVANLSRAAVTSLAPRIEARLLVTSGYLASDAVELRGFERRERRAHAGWAAELWERAS